MTSRTVPLSRERFGAAGRFPDANPFERPRMPHRKETIMDMTYPVENRKPWGASLTLSSIIIALYLIFSAYQAAA
jgi:hypothetical protein